MGAGSVILLAVIGVFILGAKSAFPDRGKPIPSIPKPAENSQSRTNAAREGYEAGFIVGEARFNDGQKGLDPAVLDRLAGIRATEIAESKAVPNVPHVKAAFIEGYRHGMSGLSRGGKPQAPLPALPIRLAKPVSVIERDLGMLNRSSKSPLKVLSKLVYEEPNAQVVTVAARFELGQGTGHVKYLYDLKSRYLLKMERKVLPSLPDTHRWSLSIDVAPTEISDWDLWGVDSRIRQINSQSKTARATVPLQYKSHPLLTEWP